MLTRDQLETYIDSVTYKPGWSFIYEEKPGIGFMLQARLPPDNSGTVWKGRKWAISVHACKSEIIQTMLAAVLAAEEHEAREQFLYKGEPVYGPHHDVDALLGLRQQTRA